MKVISSRVHGMLDYLIGLLLIAAPWLFSFTEDGAETWVPVVLGAGVIGYSLFSDYELGLVRRIALRTHLKLDLGGGVLLALSPWLFGFSNGVTTPHLVFGLIEIVAVMLSVRQPDDAIRASDRLDAVPRARRTSGQADNILA